MKSRQTHPPTIAAAKAGFSTATAYRIEADPRLLSSFVLARTGRPASGPRRAFCIRSRGSRIMPRLLGEPADALAIEFAILFGSPAMRMLPRREMINLSRCAISESHAGIKRLRKVVAETYCLIAQSQLAVAESQRLNQLLQHEVVIRSSESEKEVNDVEHGAGRN